MIFFSRPLGNANKSLRVLRENLRRKDFFEADFLLHTSLRKKKISCALVTVKGRPDPLAWLSWPVIWTHLKKIRSTSKNKFCTHLPVFTHFQKLCFSSKSQNNGFPKVANRSLWIWFYELPVVHTCDGCTHFAGSHESPISIPLSHYFLEIDLSIHCTDDSRPVEYLYQILSLAFFDENKDSMNV